VAKDLVTELICLIALVVAGVPTCVSRALRFVRAVECFQISCLQTIPFHYGVSKNVSHYTNSHNRTWKSALGLYCFLRCLTTFCQIPRLWSYGEGRASIFLNHAYVRI
jgi:hypothetical protein